MKIYCSVKVENRLYSGINVGRQSVNKFLKSTLALCKLPNKEEVVILLFTTQNRNGTKYPLNRNIKQVLTKYLHNGMCTIQFHQPQHDLYIQADAIQLKGFLHLLKQAMENKLCKGYSALSVTSIKPKEVATTKLVVKKKSEYPSKGFPRTIEILCMNEIGRCRFDSGILRLTNLKILDLSHNCIEFLPEDLNSLSNLKELKMAHNFLGRGTENQWKWMGNELAKTLSLLDISDNDVSILPKQLFKLHALTVLHIDHNNIQILPSGLGNLTKLKIFSASKNQLIFLPGSIKKLKLDYVDLSHNNFEQITSNDGILPKNLPVQSLKDYAAKKVLWKRITYAPGTIPLTLIDYLDSANFCVCGKACFGLFIKHFYHIDLSDISLTMSMNSLDTMYVPTECYFCSVKCFAYNYSKRKRNAIVR